MGGKSTSEQKQQSQTKTEPWTPAQPLMTGILNGLDPLVKGAGLTTAQSGAIGQLQQNAQQGNPFAEGINSFTQGLMGGGNANAQSGAVQGGLDDYKRRMDPYANGSMIGNNPALQAQLDVMKADIGNDINGQFAAGGRDFSGANQQAWGRGVAQGLAPVIANQYNQDVQRQMGAAESLYGAQNQTSGLLGGMNQQGLANQQQGVAMTGMAMDAKNYTPQQMLELEQLKKSLPAETLGLLAQIGIPIAGLSGTSNSTGSMQGSQRMSGADQFAKIAGGINSIGGGQGASGAMAAGGSALGALAMFSDRRMKDDIAQVGQLYDGTPVYRYRFKGDDPRVTIGLMADEVEKYAPDAIGEVGGFKTVNYETATDRAVKMAGR